MLAARTHAMAKIGPKDGEVHEVQLLADEAGGLLYETGIATITFYKGDFAAASSAVRAQFGAVVEANPWLCGRLVSWKDAAGKAGVRLRHPTVCSEEQVSAMFASRPLAGGVAGWRRRWHSLSDFLHRDVRAEQRRLVHVPEAAVTDLRPLTLGRQIRRVEARVPPQAGHLFRASLARGVKFRVRPIRRRSPSAMIPGPHAGRYAAILARRASRVSWASPVPPRRRDGGVPAPVALFFALTYSWFGIKMEVSKTLFGNFFGNPRALTHTSAEV